jgi:hypothetical protein
MLGLMLQREYGQPHAVKINRFSRPTSYHLSDGKDACVGHRDLGVHMALSGLLILALEGRAEVGLCLFGDDGTWTPA